jgi:hypothetical protein
MGQPQFGLRKKVGPARHRVVCLQCEYGGEARFATFIDRTS